MHQISNNFTFLSFQTGRTESALNHTNELLKEGMVLWLIMNPHQVKPSSSVLPPHRIFGANSWHGKRNSFPSPNRFFQGTAWNHYKPKGAFTARSLVSVVTGGFFARMWVLFPYMVNYVGEFQHARNSWLCACVRYLSAGHPTKFHKRVWFHGISTLRYLIGLFNIALF